MQIRQIVGIPMGNILFCYERDFMLSRSSDGIEALSQMSKR